MSAPFPAPVMQAVCNELNAHRQGKEPLEPRDLDWRNNAEYRAMAERIQREGVKA